MIRNRNSELGCISACMVFILIIVVILVAKYVENCGRVRRETIQTRSNFTNVNDGSDDFVDESFTVQNNPNEPDWVGKEVAKRLHNLAQKGDQLVIECFDRSYPDRHAAERLAQRWKGIRKNNTLRETAFGEKSAAYTVNKGDELRICIRDPDKENLFENENTSVFVLLHEMAHLMSVNWGHGKRIQGELCKIS